MTPSEDLRTSILYQDATKKVTLIDIPKSLSLAQGTDSQPCFQVLYSLPPQEKQYSSAEPVRRDAIEKAKKSLAPSSFSKSFLIEGLNLIHANHILSFCLPRKSRAIQPSSDGETRKETNGFESVDIGNRESGLNVPEPARFSNLWRLDDRFQNQNEAPLAPQNKLGALTIENLTNRVICNLSPEPFRITVDDNHLTYKVPPQSIFFLSKIGWRQASHFSSAVYKIFPEPSHSAAPGQFDFILLDPPWNNRSARRSKSYKTSYKAREDPLGILSEMLGKHIAPGGLVACWLTNNARVRTAALKLFEDWDLELIEEWAWLKTTVHGEPVCDIDSVTRKPYEILLLARAAEVTLSGLDQFSHDAPVQKRLLVGVPDIHSRKPCLKELVEPLMEDRPRYRALEIFARNLTAGWCSWGDEVLKYNWEGHWPE